MARVGARAMAKVRAKAMAKVRPGQWLGLGQDNG